MIKLPDKPLPAISDITANNMLFFGDYGIGKSGLLASTGYLIANPESENKIRQYPNTLPVHLKNWQDHKDLITSLVSTPEGKYKGIGLDSLNVSYDYCLSWVMQNVKFNGARLDHPSINPTMCYPRITMEFITWLREVTMLGYHVIATCHSNISEVKIGGYSYNSFIPAFTGSSPTSTYAGILKVFSIVGFLTMEEIEEPRKDQEQRTIQPPTATKLGKKVVDVRADTSRIDAAKEGRIIHFNQSKYWLANNKNGGFPDKVKLTDNWRQDWEILKKAWGSQAHILGDEVVEGGGQMVGEDEDG